MKSLGIGHAAPVEQNARGQQMRTSEDVAAMLRLSRMGWGSKRIARELGISQNTVKRYLEANGVVPYRQPRRGRALDGLSEWLTERFLRHRGNADVVRQELAAEQGVSVSLRTVERAVAPLRARLRAEAKATIRFETPPGRQMQIDFGEIRVSIGERCERIHLFVATLGYSRLLYADAFDNERQSAWLGGVEAAFRHCGGLPRELLVDNAKALVTEHDRKTRVVRFNPRFEAFCRYWGVAMRACAPMRARTKGKDERGVGYVKGNAIAGRRFESFEHLRSHLAQWTREIADVRIHGTTREAPRIRFERDEAHALFPLDGKPPFLQCREVVRRVHSDSCIEIDTNRYSVPWTLIGEAVTVTVDDAEVRVEHGGELVARHTRSLGRYQVTIDRAHLFGIVGASRREAPAAASLQRPLADYEQALGGGW
jgi:transposase